MRNKIMIMTLLCALLVGLVPPGSVRAEDEFNHYDAETKTIFYNGQSCYVGDDCAKYVDSYYKLIVANISSSGNLSSLLFYLFPELDVELSVRSSGNCIVHLVRGGSLLTLEQLPEGVRLYRYNLNSSTGALEYKSKATVTSEIFAVESSSGYYDEFGNKIPRAVWNGGSVVIYSDLNIYKGLYSDGVSYVSNDLFYRSDVGQESFYSFYNWCAEANVNCVPSTRTNLVYEDFVYNSWFDYVVTKNADCYSVYQFYSNDSIERFTEFVSYDNRLYLHLKDDISGADFFIKRFDYVADGWLCSDVSFCTLKYGELVDLGVVISDDNKLFYSSETIKTGELYGNTYYPKNTEFTQGFAGEVSPDHNPQATPTPVPIVPPSGVVGGAMITYNPSLNGEVSADSLNMRKEASIDSEIVGAFIKNWSLVLHGFVENSDGLWYFCTAERDGQTYTGYVLSEYVKIVGGSGVSGSGSTLDETLSKALEELESLAVFVARVPMVIGVIFSFMPPWCLGLMGIAFIFLVLGAISRK